MGWDGVNPLPMLMPLPWMDRALCANFDPDAWFPTKGGAASIDVRAICDICPVVKECLAHVLSLDVHVEGIWAGLNKEERRKLRPGSNLDRRHDSVRPHGTEAAYRRHFRQGTTPCQACTDADSTARAARRQRARERAA